MESLAEVNSGLAVSKAGQEAVLSSEYYSSKKDIVTKRLQIAHVTLEEVEKYNAAYNLNEKFDGFGEELDLFRTELGVLQQKVDDALEAEDNPALYSMEAKINGFVEKLITSKSVSNFSLFKFNKEVYMKVYGGSPDFEESQDDSIVANVGKTPQKGTNW